MGRIPFQIIKAAKGYDSEAVDFIFRYFAGYIESKCTYTYTDEEGNACTAIDEELYYRAELALFAAIRGYSFDAPPDDTG